MAQAQHPAVPAVQLKLFTGTTDASTAIRWLEYVEEHVIPWLATNGAVAGTLDEYIESARLFAALVGDPELKNIGAQQFSAFKSGLARLPARRPRKRPDETYAEHIWQCIEPKQRPDETTSQFATRQAAAVAAAKQSANTRRKHCITVNRLLGLAGPSKFADDDTLGFLKKSPRMKPPAQEIDDNVEAYTDAEWSLWLAGLDAATRPGKAYTGFDAPLWWRALLPFLRESGVREGTALSARWEWIDAAGWMHVPPGGMKQRRGKPVYLSQAARAAIEPLRPTPAVGLIFGWPRTWPQGYNTLYRGCQQTQSAAGLPRERWIGLHAIRATCAGRLIAATGSVELAQKHLGHTKAATTIRHYGPQAAIAAAVESMT